MTVQVTRETKRADARLAEAPGDESDDESDVDEVEPTVSENVSALFAWLVAAYGSFDRRTLALTRILLGFMLTMDLFRRAPGWFMYYGEHGLFPVPDNGAAPFDWSVFRFLPSDAGISILFALILVTYLCLLVGYQTRVAQVLSLVFVNGLAARAPEVANGGNVALGWLMVWTTFAPLGDRFSVDSLRASMRRSYEATAAELNARHDLIDEERTRPFVTLASIAILFQACLIYALNAAAKTSVHWRDFTAVHYVIYSNRLSTPFTSLIRDHIPDVGILAMTGGTLAIEFTLPILFLIPIARTWSKRFAIVLMNALHLALGTMLLLGFFSWAMCLYSTLLVSREDWEIAGLTMRRTHRARTVVFNPKSPRALALCRLLVRLDRFELLRFEERNGVEGGLGAEDAAGHATRRFAALAEIVAALPLGPTVAWMLRGSSALLDRVWVAFEKSAPTKAAVPPPREQKKTRGRVLPVLREVTIALLMLACIPLLAEGQDYLRPVLRVRPPAPMRLASLKFGLNQAWHMFAPQPLLEDAMIVVDAVTVDGRNIDPMTGRKPYYDLAHSKSLGYDQFWCDYTKRVPVSAPLQHAFRDYLLRYHERTGRPEDRLVEGKVFVIRDTNPEFGSTEPTELKKILLFTFGKTAPKPPPRPDEPAPSAEPSDERDAPQ